MLLQVMLLARNGMTFVMIHSFFFVHVISHCNLDLEYTCTCIF